MKQKVVFRSAVVFLLTIVAPAAGSVCFAEGRQSSRTPQGVCTIEPRLLDVARNPGPLIARIELYSPDGLEARDGAGIDTGVYVRSVAGTRLPEPDGRSEGIGERVAARRLEDRADVRGRSATPNGIREAVVRFDLPSDGDPRTREDGNAGDVLAMLTDVPHGESVEICLAARADDEVFTCCASVQVSNRGLRDLPRGLHRTGSRAGD